MFDYHRIAGITIAGLMICGVVMGAWVSGSIADQPAQETHPDYEESLERWLLPEYDFNDNDLAGFNALVEDALVDSATHKNNVVIINKSEYKLHLVRSGRVTHSFPIELGFDAVHDKRMEGDGCTPEGEYRTTDKRDVWQTVFHRGFLISYPTNADRSDFKSAKAAGELPADASIGGGIMIHGIGSGEAGNAGGSNWTLGCISLSNDDIDELFPHVSGNTRVVIVRYSDVDLPQ